MWMVEYIKTVNGEIVVLGKKEITTNGAAVNNIDRFNTFFENVPLWGGKEWRTLSTEEIISFFHEAVVDIHNFYQQRQDEGIKEHLARNYLVRWWMESRGWKAPYVPSQKEITQYMVNRCRYLSGWMREKSTSKFYCGSDMNYLIQKPSEVADILAKSL